MDTQKKQTLKRFTYICLSLSTLMFSPEGQAKGLSDDVSEDRTEVYMNKRKESRQRREEIAAKYGIKLPPPRHYTGPRLGDSANQFHQSATMLRQGQEERNEQLNQAGKIIVKGAGALADNVIEKNVKDETAKSILTRLKESAVSFFNSFFSK